MKETDEVVCGVRCKIHLITDLPNRSYTFCDDVSQDIKTSLA